MKVLLEEVLLKDLLLEEVLLNEVLLNEVLLREVLLKEGLLKEVGGDSSFNKTWIYTSLRTCRHNDTHIPTTHIYLPHTYTYQAAKRTRSNQSVVK